MRVVVLGAGVIGTTAAWYLAADGHAVTVVDRQPGAGIRAGTVGIDRHRTGA